MLANLSQTRFASLIDVMINMKILYYSLCVLFAFLASSAVYAETNDFLVNSIYFVELLIMGSVSLALIILFLLIFNERGRRIKKIELVYEELDQKASVMQMMLNSVREKEQNVIKITKALQYNNNRPLLEVDREEEKQDVIDPRTLDVNGKVKQPHFGRKNYLIAMRNAHSQGLEQVRSIDDSLQAAIADAVDMSDGNLQEIDSFYQKLSELIEALEVEEREDAMNPSNQHMVETLGNIQRDFEELMKHQTHKQHVYQALSKHLDEKSYRYPTEIVSAVLEK